MVKKYDNKIKRFLPEINIWGWIGDNHIMAVHYIRLVSAVAMLKSLRMWLGSRIVVGFYLYVHVLLLCSLCRCIVDNRNSFVLGAIL